MRTTIQTTTLLPKIARGDQESMRKLIDQYTGLVWSLVRPKINNAGDAEDLVQEIFADIWKNAHRYNPDLGAESTFISVIARRRTIDAIRKSTRTPSTLEISDTNTPSTEDPTTPSTHDAQQALHILNSLNPQRRKVLELSILRGLSHAQIVKATDLPLGTVKAHIRRGLQEIRALLPHNNAPHQDGRSHT